MDGADKNRISGASLNKAKETSIGVVDHVRLRLENQSIATVDHLQSLLLGPPFDEQVFVEQAPGLRPDTGISLGHGLHAALEPDDERSKGYVSDLSRQK